MEQVTPIWNPTNHVLIGVCCELSDPASACHLLAAVLSQADSLRTETV